MEKENLAYSESLMDIVKGIDERELLFPEFQRDFVWDFDKTLDLFDSFVRKIFVGTVIYGRPSQPITIREIDNRPRKSKGKRRNPLNVRELTNEEIRTTQPRLVLDGQQRITSIYRALKGIDTVWFVAKNPCEIPLSPYQEAELWTSDLFNALREDIKNDKINLEHLLYTFSKEEDQDHLSIKLEDAYTINCDNLRDDEVRPKYFEKLGYFKDILCNSDECCQNTYFNLYRLLDKQIDAELLSGSKLVSHFLLDMSTEKFAMFFERSNSRGMHLNFIDILIAKHYTHFNIKGKITEEKSYKLNLETIVRAIAFISSKEKKKGIHVDKNYILGQLDHSDLSNNWDNVVQLYDETISYLVSNKYILGKDLIPYENMIIPMMMFLNNIKNKKFSQMTHSQAEFLDYWYWSAAISKRYSGGGTNEIIILDSEQMIHVAMNEPITVHNYFKQLDPQKLIKEPADLIDIPAKSNSPVYKAVISLMVKSIGGVPSWRSGSCTSEAIDSHHIFPKEYLDKMGVDDMLKESLVNRVLISKTDNIGFGEKAPSQYLQRLLKDSDNPNLKNILEMNLIPGEIINGEYDSKYYDFLNIRAEKIYDFLKKRVFDKSDSISKNHLVKK